MSYKTILVHADPSRHTEQRIRLAASLAIAQDAHLVGTAMSGISRLIYETGVMPAGDVALSSHIAALKERASGALAEFEALAKKLGVNSVETRLVDDEPAGGISLQARYADLAVISQTDRDEINPALADLPQYVALNCARPVLIVPHAGQFSQVGQKILVAWDGSSEATRAVTGALPLLQGARQVEVVVINPDAQEGVHGAQPGADIALYLARHGIKVAVTQKTTSGDIGDALLSHATDTSADLLVMGCYGHSRFREVMLGGVSNTVLSSMTVPVLMAH